MTHDVAQAVRLSDRVRTMSQRPGRVAETFDATLPHVEGREAAMLSERYTRLASRP